MLTKFLLTINISQIFIIVTLIWVSVNYVNKKINVIALWILILSVINELLSNYIIVLGYSYNASYNLFTLIYFNLWIFIFTETTSFKSKQILL